MKARGCPALVAVLATVLLGACSTDRLYGTVRSYQMLTCYRLPDLQQRDHCLHDAVISYDQYQREAQQLKPAVP